MPGFGPGHFADDLTVGPDGAVYAALDLPGTVVRLDPATGEVRERIFDVAVSDGRAIGADGRSLLVADDVGDVVWRVTAA